MVECCGDAGEPGERPDREVPCGVDAPVEDGCGVVGAIEAVGVGGVAEDRDRVSTGGGDLKEMRAKGRPGWFAGEPQHDLVGLLVEGLHFVGPEVLFAGCAEPVEVLRDGGGELGGGVVGMSLVAAGRQGGLVVGQDVFEDVFGGPGGEGVVVDGVGQPVAGDGGVEVVGVPAAAGGGVELLAGFVPGDEGVAGVGGDALGGVDRGGVAEFGPGLHIVGRQLHVATPGQVGGGEGAVGGGCAGWSSGRRW